MKMKNEKKGIIAINSANSATILNTAERDPPPHSKKNEENETPKKNKVP